MARVHLAVQRPHRVVDRTVTLSRSAALRDRNSSALQVSAHRRLMREITDGVVSDETYARYLAIEEDFVRTAVRVAAFCVWADPAWDRVQRHADTVQVLLGEQLDYFAELRTEWVADPAALPEVLEEASVLRQYVLAAVGAGGYGAAVTGMLAAETLYLGWCTVAAASPAPRPPAIQDWLDLHTSASFAGQVAFLESLVDDLPGEISNDQLDEWFDGMLRAEDIFHDSVYRVQNGGNPV
jgi:thiaminase/transcriptional activator TenA